MSAELSQRAFVTTVEANDIEEWRAIAGASFVPLDVAAPREDYFRGRLRHRALGDVSVSEVSTSDHTVKRTPALILLGDKRMYKLSLQVAGSWTVSQDGRQACLQPGDMVIYNTDHPYSIESVGESRNITIMFPQNLIDLPAATVNQLTATTILSEQGLMPIVGPFLKNLVDNLGNLTVHSGMRIAHNVLDLVATILYGQLNALPGFQTNGHRVALVQEIHSYIDDHLSDPALRPDSIAAANYISTRHLHGIFGEQGITVSAWIRSRRLEHCRRELADPLFLDQPVSAVSARWGFIDASHFSRLFRATFGDSPAGYRRRHLLELRKDSVDTSGVHTLRA